MLHENFVMKNTLLVDCKTQLKILSEKSALRTALYHQIGPNPVIH